jgi:gamma-glutamyltranspeptidase / glutathione hydrolase
MRDLELPGRSPARALTGMAATSQALASVAAIDILKAGGNAIDAAIAACAVQCVVEPESTGIGGDCFALISKGGSDDIIAYNGSGRAPMAATTDWYVKKGIKKIERQTPHAVTVPGAVDAWARLLADHGTMSLGTVLAPAIAYARDGYAISSRVSVDFDRETKVLLADPTAKRIMLPDGKAPKEGDVHRQTELAKTLQHIADNGRDAFYKGWVAEDIVSHLQSVGGLHTLEDFATAEGEYVTPVSGEYLGHRVVECPPNGQGIIALELMNILSALDMKGHGPLSVERLHRLSRPRPPCRRSK